MFLQDDDDNDSRTFTMEELEPSRNFSNPVYETMFQETHAPIIKNNAVVSNITSVAEQTTLLQPSTSADEEPSHSLETEQSELMGETNEPPRQVINTDSD